MEDLEKIVFLEMTNKQLTKLPNKEYYETVKLLTKKENEEFTKLNSEIHNIWNYINSKKSEGIHNFEVSTIEEYNDKITPISEIILKVSSDFGITLKNGISDKLKNAILKTLGKDSLDEFLK